MSRERIICLTTAAFLLEVLPRAYAHSAEHSNGSIDMSAAVKDASQHSSAGPGIPTSYWGLTEHVSLIYWHIGLELLAWTVILPLGVMFSIARSNLALASQFVFLAVNALALLLGVVYKHRTPELYENNAHGKTGWIITWIASAWALMALVDVYAVRTKADAFASSGDALNVANMARYQRVQDLQEPEVYRWSNDSGQGTERNSASLYSHSRSPSVESEQQQHFIERRQRHVHFEDYEEESDAEKRSFVQGTAVTQFLSRHVARFASGKPLVLLRICYVLIERTILVAGFVAIATGTVVYGGIGHGGAVFNVLAHFIKGSIFFGYGLLTLGRWMGAFADFGWAWNRKPGVEVVGRRRAAVPSAEFVESFVIFLYGCSNVFLEHLAAWGDAWTAQDLEHVSISVMFFGGGLLGMLVESTALRSLLNRSVLAAQPASPQFHGDDLASSWQSPSHYRVSMNPLPALIILLLGKMMSSHHQASQLSTMIHAQWGSLFIMFAFARVLTYVTLYLVPPSSYLPSRPPTEIVSAFCLVAGGVTFVLSNKDTVAALEAYGLDAMFTFTITIGMTLMVMAWTVTCVAVKGWAMQRKHSVSGSGVGGTAMA